MARKGRAGTTATLVATMALVADNRRMLDLLKELGAVPGKWGAGSARDDRLASRRSPRPRGDTRALDPQGSGPRHLAGEVTLDQVWRLRFIRKPDPD